MGAKNQMRSRSRRDCERGDTVVEQINGSKESDEKQKQERL